VEKFAPWLKVMTLHNDEDPRFQKIASADMVIASNWLLQGDARAGRKAKTILNSIRKIHWHRIIVDEAHYNQSTNSKTNQVLSSFSATHRHCVTGKHLSMTPFH